MQAKWCQNNEQKDAKNLNRAERNCSQVNIGFMSLKTIQLHRNANVATGYVPV